METTTRQSAQVSPQIAAPFSDHPSLWGAVRRYYAVVDSLGVIRAVCDCEGNAATFSYGLYGDVRSVSDLTPDLIASKSSLRYKSYPFEAELGLYLLGGRLYHPLLGRFLAPDSPGFTSIGEPSGLNPYCYCRNDPVNYSDRSGYSPEWWEWANAIGKIATGIFAVAAGALVIASGVAGVGMLVVAGITVTAGALTINNGIADTVGLSTGYNYMADGLFQGNTTAYGWYSGITEGVAVAGTIACGGWLKYNAPRISAYHNIGNYQFSNTLSDAEHMARPWQNSVLMQQNVIKYGRMAKDGAGWAFTAAGSFNGHGEAWRLIVSVAEEAIWHWGFF